MSIIDEVNQKLKESNISVEILDLRSLNPIDYKTIEKSIKKTNKLVAIDTSRKNGGIMAELVSNIQEKFHDWLDGPIIRIGAEDVPWPYNKDLENAVNPSSNKVIEKIYQQLSLKLVYLAKREKNNYLILSEVE